MRRKKFSKERFYRRLNAKQQVSYEPNYFENFMIDFAKALDKTVIAFKDMVTSTYQSIGEMSPQQLKDLELKLNTERKYRYSK